MTRFSQRIGETESVKNLQIEFIDEDLINGLWNMVKIFILDRISRDSQYSGMSDFDHFSKLMWHRFLKLPIDTIPVYDFQTEKFIRNKFFNDEWFEVYDILEFLSKLKITNVDTHDFIEATNNLLEREFSGYRFVDGLIAPISNSMEIDEIEEAIGQVNYFTSLNGANVHLTNALSKLSDKKNPDYRNSIKESISAVETTCRIITGENTLGKALNKLETSGLNIDTQLKAGFDKIYAYTNNKENGIRHAIIEKHKNPDFNEAKYMIVASSAFINYLVGKCKTLGIKIN